MPRASHSTWAITAAVAGLAIAGAAGAPPAPAHEATGTLALREAFAERLLDRAQRSVVGAGGRHLPSLLRAGAPLKRAHAALGRTRAGTHSIAHTGTARVRAARLSGARTRLILAGTPARGVPAARLRPIRRALLVDASARLRVARALSAAPGGASSLEGRRLAGDMARGLRIWRARLGGGTLPRALRAPVARVRRIESASLRTLAAARMEERAAPPATPAPVAPEPAPTPAPAPTPEPMPAPAPAPVAPDEPEPDEAAAPAADFAVSLRQAIPYANPERAPAGGLLLDAYLPDSPGVNRPAVVLVHGGAWRGGSRADMALAADALARRGFPAFAIDYRKDGTHPVPEQYADVRSALAWVRAEAGAHGVDPTRVALLGASSGGHLAAMVATTDAGSGIPGGKPAALVAWSGVMDLRDTATDTTPRAGCDPAPLAEGGTCDLPRWMVSIMPRQMGAPIDDVVPWLGNDTRPPADPALYDDNSPVRHVVAGAPPSLLVHAEGDPLVGAGQARAMTDALRARGSDAHLLMVPGEGHANQLHGIAMPTTAAFLAAALGDPAG